jgi:hypothetical protein
VIFLVVIVGGVALVALTTDLGSRGAQTEQPGGGAAPPRIIERPNTGDAPDDARDDHDDQPQEAELGPATAVAGIVGRVAGVRALDDARGRGAPGPGERRGRRRRPRVATAPSSAGRPRTSLPPE